MMCSAFAEICTDRGNVRLLAVGGADGCVHVLAQQSDGQVAISLFCGFVD
jgi:chitinase